MSDDKFERSSPEAVSPWALGQFDLATDDAERDVVLACSTEDDISALGPDAERKMLRGLGFTGRMLRSTMALGVPGILDDELRWASTRLPIDGVSPLMLLANLRRYLEALERRLPSAAMAEIRPYLLLMLQQQERLAAGL